MSRSAALAGYWHPVAFSSAVAGEPLGTTLLGERVVVWRDGSGAVVAARDRCPHRGTALSLGAVDPRGRLVCPNHGWHFDSAGSCVEVPQLPPGAPLPARARLGTFCCEERHGLVWVCLGDPVAEIPAYPERADPAFRHVACGPYRWRTSPERVVERFADLGQPGPLWDDRPRRARDRRVPSHRVERVGDELRYALDGGSLPPIDYVLSLPFSLRLSSADRSGDRRGFFLAVQPHGDGTCSAYCYRSRAGDAPGDDAEERRRQDELAERDRPIVESQVPAEVPLEPNGEIHLAVDRVAVAYRRALAELFDEADRTYAAGA